MVVVDEVEGVVGRASTFCEAECRTLIWVRIQALIFFGLLRLPYLTLYPSNIQFKPTSDNVPVARRSLLVPVKLALDPSAALVWSGSRSACRSLSPTSAPPPPSRPV